MPATDQQRAVAVCVAVVGLAAAAGVAGSTGVAVAVAVAVAVTAAVALFFDHFVGFLLGLGASAAVILGRRVLGPWGDEEFWLASSQTIGLVATGFAAAHAGRGLRAREPDPSTAASGGLPAPVFGSLGLLDADIALERLQEEIERAQSHRRPLTVLIVEVTIPSAEASEVARAARRAVSRLFESRLPATDVPFALAEDRLGAVLPETAAADAWVRVGELLDAVAEGTFQVRSEQGERALVDTVAIEVGMAELQPGVADAHALLDAATAALPRHEATRDPG